MKSLLMQEMSNADIDWLRLVGKVIELAPNQTLVQSNAADRQVHLLLNGGLTVALPHQESVTPQQFAQLTSGDVMGAIPALETFCCTAIMQAQMPCQILAISQAQLADKLAQDTAFAAHFYRIQALLIQQRLQALMSQFHLNPAILHQINVKETAILFAELQDCDLDWFTAVGQWQQIPTAAILQPADRPIEALHIVLDGALSLCTVREYSPDLADVFLASDTAPASVQELARIARGDVFGEMQFVQMSAPALSMPMVQAVRDTEVLSIPRWRLGAKLLHDLEFASRFYRVLAVLMANKYQTIVSQLGFVTQPEPPAAGSSDRLLTQMARAETRFEWMVQRIQTKVTTGGEMPW